MWRRIDTEGHQKKKKEKKYIACHKGFAFYAHMKVGVSWGGGASGGLMAGVKVQECSGLVLKIEMVLRAYYARLQRYLSER